MERFVRRENVKHYRELLNTVQDEPERQRILQQKQQDAEDKVEEDNPRGPAQE